MEERIMKKSLFLVAALVVLAACARNQEIDIPNANLTLIATTEAPADTKTIVEGGIHVYWEPGDEISVFNGEKSAKFVSELTASSATATFKGTFGDDTWPEDIELWAVYPFSEDAVFDGETITTTLPSEQVARAGSFGKDMNLAVANSFGTTLQFYNVGGGIRFSVTEEGIKKVMFEGLNGEIISGKVKIGLDENGLPKVQEVTSGSQFITLLPPEGSKTFEKDTWYYIVAIPGALEKGYKLRFYKDDDYARKVSETAVQIKRSIYGNIEKADEGIEYAPQTTHFPETKEEWKESLQLTQSIGTVALQVLDSLRTSDSSNKEAIENEVRRIEGVDTVIFDYEERVVSIMQKDSLWVNYFLDYPSDHLTDTPASSNSVIVNRISSSNSLSPNRSSQRRTAISGDNMILNQKRNALFLIPPFDYSNWFYWSYLNDVKNNLIHAGFDPSNIVVKTRFGYENEDGTGIRHFMGEWLSDYDFVFIRTHGGTGYRAKKPKGKRVYKQTILFSSTSYDEDFVETLVDSGAFQWEDIAVSAVDENNDNKAEYYLCMTTSFLDNAHFDNACVMITACNSARYLSNDNGESMIQSFINKGAGVVSGYRNITMNSIDTPLSANMVLLMSHGLSFQDAIKYLKNLECVNNYSRITYSWWEKNYKKENYTKDDLGWIKTSLYASNYYYKTKAGDEHPYFLINPFPSLVQTNDMFEPTDCRLSWDCDLEPFQLTWPDTDDGIDFLGETTIDYQVLYDVYVNESLAFSNVLDKSVSWTPTEGVFRWYVVAKIMEGNTEIASYQSESSSFVVYSRPQAKDLGLSVKWASFNLGATKQEERGYYYAWGETIPCPGLKTSFHWTSYIWNKGSEVHLTKYNSSSSYGVVDGKMELDPEDDVVHMAFGDKWRIPTKSECQDLIDKCSWEWTTLNGVNGYTVTGTNGQSIFLPVAGYMNETILWGENDRGRYWSSEIDMGSPYSAGSISFSSSGVNYLLSNRYEGHSIRPVYGDKKTTPGGDIEGTERDPWN